MLDEICQKARAKGIVVGAFGGHDYETWKRRGADWISLSFDEAALSNSYRAMLAEARKVNKYTTCSVSECKSCAFQQHCSDSKI
jgi:hypothetical protein